MDLLTDRLNNFKVFLNKHGGKWRPFPPLIQKWIRQLSKLGNFSDKRVADWFMMDSPYSSAVICLVYVILVMLGPSIMKNRQPYQLKSVLLVYNFLMVVASGYVFYEFLMAGWLNDYSFACQPVDYSNSPKALRVTTTATRLANDQ